MASLNSDSHRGNSKNESEANGISVNENYENPVVTLVNLARSSTDVLPVEGESKEPYPDVTGVVKDLDSCMKEFEILFVWRSNSGKEVPRILEEDKIQFCPLLPEEIAHGSKPSSFLQTLFACCWEDVSIPESPSQAEIKYLTWHRSVSSQLSTSRNPLGSNDSIYISVLDRFYGWESKLYDEMGVGILTSYTPADVQASLLRFLEKLEAFSEISQQRYTELQKEMSAAKEMVWRKD